MLFCAFFGLTMHIFEDADANRIELYLNQAFEVDFTSFLSFTDYFAYEIFGRIDFVQPLLLFFVSRFSNDVNILLATMGLIFGFFYSRNIWYLIDFAKGKTLKFESTLYLWLFIFLVPIWFINGFRFYTALHVFIYGFFKYLDNKKSSYFFIILSLFFHDTFIITISLFCLFLVVKNFPKILYFVYLYSVSGLLTLKELVANYVESLPSLFKERKGYVDENYIEVVAEQQLSLNWYVEYKYTLVKFLVFGTYFFIFSRRFTLISNNKYLLFLFSLSLIFNSFANFVEDVPSMYRFYFVGFLSQMAFLVIFFQVYNFQRRPEWYKLLSAFVAVIFILVEFWNGLMYTTLATVIGNPFTFFIFDFSKSFYSILKEILT